MINVISYSSNHIKPYVYKQLAEVKTPLSSWASQQLTHILDFIKCMPVPTTILDYYEELAFSITKKQISVE